MRGVIVSAIGLFFVLGACATVQIAPPAYRYEVVDDTQARQFIFRFTSLDDRALCVVKENWPYINPDGIIVDPPYLQTAGGERIPKPFTQSDASMLCGRSDNPDCGRITVKPHEALETRLDYALFDDPDTLAADTMRHFKTYPNYPDVKVCQNRLP